jgi:hypothetical protein
VSTGYPIVPSPPVVRIERVAGGVVEMLGYTLEAVIADKGATILERGVTSTRWRDYVDIVQLAQSGFDPGDVVASGRAIARHRAVALELSAVGEGLRT